MLDQFLHVPTEGHSSSFVEVRAGNRYLGCGERASRAIWARGLRRVGGGKRVDRRYPVRVAEPVPPGALDAGGG